MVRGSCSGLVGLVFCSAQGHSGTRRALRVDEVTVDAGMHVREAIDEAVVDDHAERLGEGVRFAAVVVSATARAAASCRHLDRLGHAAAVILRSPRRLRRSPDDAPLRPAGALVNRTSPADCRITDPRVSNCWSPMRSAPSGAPGRGGRAAGAGPGAPRLLAGHATAGAALPGTPGAWTCLPGAGPTRTRMPQQSGPVRLVCHAESRHADGGIWLVVRQDGNHLEFEWEDAPVPVAPCGRSVFRRSPRYVRDSVLLSAGTALHACRDRVGCCRWSDTERRAGARDRHRPAPGYHLVVDIDVDQGVCSEAGSFPIRSMNASQRAWRLAFRQAAGRRLTASRVDARLAALMPANPPGRSRLPAGKT